MSEGKPSVYEAWAAVMGEVRELAKDQRAHQFNFRGIDAVMNAFGPALRRHNVAVVPSVDELRTDTAQSQQGKLTQIVRVIVTYTVYGPAGDFFLGSAAGEANDVSDKATAKAMSVAMRTFMLQAACLPTHDTDPDVEGEVLAGDPQAQVRQWVEEATAKGPEALEALGKWGLARGWPEEALREVRNRIAALRGGK